ncbi:MAG: bifunctional phosphopantothenoylcysteine decarboxylase/phosphopantothenate--cysteine ligase CoaBC, partial [Armatimonadetes bacterium]|nr:bifunctional phosphopantothenoylcysteine decarboxylase/phosphopantothenate--cysteine ligase CoaBC [Armatimonadota bacterium]
KLRQRGVIIVEPEEGFLACGESGRGRLARLETLLAAVRYALRRADMQGKPSFLAGQRVLITAGPTREYLDPVRFVSNASSGAMGFALAAEAAARGAQVRVVHGPTDLAPPPDTEALPVTTAAEMAEAVFAALDQADIFIGAAAVADYTPEAPAAQKQPKSAQTYELRLVPTTDIIAEVRRRKPHLAVVGFAAETHDVEARAREKLQRKGMDMIVANEVGRDKGFGPGDTQLTIILADGASRQTGPVAKDEAASLVIDALEDLLRARSGEST